MGLLRTVPEILPTLSKVGLGVGKGIGFKVK